MSTFFFRVEGIPRPGGSKRVFMVNGKPVLTDASGKKGRDWRGDIKRAAIDAGAKVLEGPLRLEVSFRMPRPKAHYRSNGTLKPSAPVWHEKRPDATKLLRALEDALTGILWRDDAQIVVQRVRKAYAITESPGASVAVTQYGKAVNPTVEY